MITEAKRHSKGLLRTVSEVARAFLVDTVMFRLSAAEREEIKSQIISVIEHISKVKIRFDGLEDRTSILS